MTCIIVESADCQVLVNALNNKADYDRPIGVLVCDDGMLARLNFSSISFEFCNKAAQAMEELGASGVPGDGLIWPDAVPTDVVVSVARDSAMSTSEWTVEFH
jgi:hypothetical protein